MQCTILEKGFFRRLVRHMVSNNLPAKAFALLSPIQQVTPPHGCVLLACCLHGCCREEPGRSYIENLAWDPEGHRLAVVLAKQHPAAGTVALYSTSHSPVVECNLIGFVQPGACEAAGEADADARGDSAALKGSTGGEDVQLHIAFAPVAGKAKAVLSVGQCSASEAERGSWGLVRNIPLYF